MQWYASKGSAAEERKYRIRLLGTGAADPTKEIGQGVTVTHTATGVYKVTFAEGPGTFINAHYMLGAATPSDVKGHTVTRDTPVTTSGVTTIEFSLWNASDAADDLQATEYLDLTIVYAETSEAD